MDKNYFDYNQLVTDINYNIKLTFTHSYLTVFIMDIGFIMKN